MTGALIPERFVAVNPSMVRTFGLAKAVILQEIHFSSCDPRLVGEEGGTKLSQGMIAELTGLSRTTVNRHCGKLEADGFVVTSQEHATAEKEYSLVYDAVLEAVAPARQLVAMCTSACAGCYKCLCQTAQGTYITKKNNKKGTAAAGGGSPPPPPEDKPNPLTDPDYERYRNAANYVLRRWAEVNERPKQKLTAKAVEDMRLLMQRGPANWETPAPITGDEIRAVVEAALADDFWSDNLQSPGGLRKHWDKLALLARPKNGSRAAGVNPDQAVTKLVATYNTVGHQGWKFMLDALDDPVLRQIAEAVGQRPFQGDLRSLEFAIRSQARTVVAA